ncbi:MAG TPA: hypothetical protein VEK82_01650 [Stellaceae bacterium]|nr:hypothetical protein [Stellaceae bacterium]
MHPIADKAEIAIDFPDKLYIGEFGRHSSFDACTEADGVLIRLSRQGGEKRDAQIHLHYLLFADIVAEIAHSVVESAPIDTPHRKPLVTAIRDLLAALGDTPAAAPAA